MSESEAIAATTRKAQALARQWNATVRVSDTHLVRDERGRLKFLAVNVEVEAGNSRTEAAA